LALFKFGYPTSDGIDDFVGSLADSLGLVPFTINALSALNNFHFFVGHKHKGEQVAISINEISV